MLATEHAFVLPTGYVGADGTLHREGVMRLATAGDEVAAMLDPRGSVRQGGDDAYLPLLLLARTVVRIGDVEPVTVPHLEALFARDYAYLQRLYLRLNEPDEEIAETACPDCGARFELAIGEPAAGGA